MYCIPQRWIFGPLLFNIFLCDLFYFLKSTDIANYADVTTPYSSAETQKCVDEKLKEYSLSRFKWFSNNYMKVNSGKSHLLISGKQRMITWFDNHELESQNVEELLRIDIDSTLTVENHTKKKKKCKKPSQKLNVLARISPYIALRKKRAIKKAFITPHFGYCLLVWMLHGRVLNNKINYLNLRTLRITYGDKISSFQNLLKKITLFQNIKDI